MSKEGVVIMVPLKVRKEIHPTEEEVCSLCGNFTVPIRKFYEVTLIRFTRKFIVICQHCLKDYGK